MKKHILVIDDDSSLVDILKECLQMNDFKPVTMHYRYPLICGRISTVS
jgi:DNA-binding NtrC family response regulator